tara:strand:- start:47 stop:1441 length:1395 start_codon:yes stop_codon:yes gene_type:complete
MAISLKSLDLPYFGMSKKQPKIESQIYIERVKKFKNDLKRNNIESAIIYADREHFANIHYLTGFDPRFEEALLIINNFDDNTYLITGPENQGYANISEINLIKKNFPTFGLLGQNRENSTSLEEIFLECNLSNNKNCGIVGWKYFISEEYNEPDKTFDIPNYILNSIIKVVGGISNLKNITSWFMHSSNGYRSKNEIDEIAFFEFSSCHTSEALKNVLKNIKPGMTEYDVAAFYKPIGIPLSCHMMFSSGERAKLGLASPSSKTLNLGEPFAAAYGVWGALNCRVGWIANNEKDLPSDTRDYFEKLVVPYFKAVKAWYENLAIGVEGGLIFKEIMNILSDPFFGVYLNPGHLIHRDEWMNSPIYNNSKEKIFSGQAFQMDIIPATNTNYFSANLEDGVVILDKEDREIFKDKYPEEMERIDKRREFIINQIGINLKPEVMPLSNIPCYLSPFILNFSKIVVANN